MKKNTIFILILFCFINRIYGQATIKIEVPEVKENKQVDSLIDHITKHINSDSYFINISVSSRFDENEFLVTAVANKFPIIDLFGINKTIEGHSILLYEDRLKYCVYKGHLVFINGDADCCNLFRKSSHSRFFVFVKHDDKPTLNLIYRYIFFETYTYLNEHFLVNSFGNK